MIDQFTDRQLRRHASFPTGYHTLVVCIGDQQVCPSLRFKDVAEYFRSALGYKSHLDIDYNGNAKINHDLNFPVKNNAVVLSQMKELRIRAEIPDLTDDERLAVLSELDTLRAVSRIPRNSPEIQADLVYDGGTLEHVCNAGQALWTMAQMVKVGGLIVQESPIVPYGQAYWGVSPLVQRDFFRANGFEDVAHIIHYRKSWKMDLLHAIVTRLPKRMADRLADRVRRIPGAKETIFGHDWRNEFIYPDSAWRDRHAFYPHPQTRSMYIGRKVRDVGTVVWPQMECYPSKP